MTRRTAAWAAVSSALLFVVIVMSLVVLAPGIPALWLLLVVPAAAGAWFLRQAVLPDRDAPTSWRVRNVIGCVLVGMGLPVVVMLVASDWLFPGGEPGHADQAGLGALVLLGIVAALGAVLTLVWGAVSWVASGLRRR